jgi:hypothetical protein
VASKALVGEFEEGWQRMLRHDDRQSRWGLGDGQPAQSFPQALRAFLIETGYLPSPAAAAPASGPGR